MNTITVEKIAVRRNSKAKVALKAVLESDIK